MSTMTWFRMYKEILDDPKIGTLKDSEYRLYIEILCVACEANLCGSLGICCDELAWRLRRAVHKPIMELLKKGLIFQNEEGVIFVEGWERRQFPSDSSKERTKKHRERTSQKRHCDVTETSQKRFCDALDTEQNRTEQNRTEHNPQTPNATTPETQRENFLPKQKKNNREIKNSDVNFIFDFWKTTMNQKTAQLDAKRKKFISNALKLRYSISDLCDAITGCSRTPHNMGKNDRGETFNGLHIIFNGADNIDRFIRNFKTPPIPKTKFNLKSDANDEVLNKWLELEREEKNLCL